MNEQEAKKLVEETFKNSFSKERFTFFVKNFLNNIDQDELVLFDASVPHSYKEYIKSYEHIGRYTDPGGGKLYVLSVNLRKETSPVRARTMQRNFIGWHLREMGYRGDNALVAFYHENVDDWRFSYVKRDYFSEKDGDGKVKLKEKLTPAKRFSFLVGKNEPSHTAQNQIVPILRNDKDNPAISDIETAFNVETVTNEFFEKYRSLSLRIEEALNEIRKKDPKITADFRDKKINTADFAKKLLSQIVFLYFLQKKGWFGVARGKNWGSGSKSFLRELFERRHGEYQNFFNDIMEPLFYEALGWQRSGGYYSRFNSRIPFLNGGLFEPINDYDWIDTQILLSDEIFSNSNKTVEGDEGDGILDIFDRYNFTVKEDEPLEREVAIDPEMLGKVFENLLESEDRKSKGTYYTPRKIVYYMCQESLVNYLNTELSAFDRNDFEKLIKYSDSVIDCYELQSNNANEVELPETVRGNATLIDEKLSSIRVCDPAVGSGAFVVGMMSEIVRVRNALTPYMSSNPERIPYNFKRDAIQNCLYGVDIDPGAVEIAKLRLWLSLIVDEEKQENIKPLPNLDYKIVRGDSLLGFPYTPQGLEKIEELKRKFFGETNPEIKKQLKEEINEAIRQQLGSTKLSLGYKLDFDFKIFFSEIFKEKGGFDVVIGNPPYVQLQKMKGDPIREAYQKQKYETFDLKGDIYCLFYEKACRLLKPEGILSYITSNSWLRIAYGGSLRFYFFKHTPLKLLEMGKDVFENVTVDTNILLLRHGKSNKTCEGVDMERLQSKDFPPEKRYWKHVRVDKEKPWTILSPIEHRITGKIEKIGTPLKEWDITINYGIKTGCNDAFIISNETKEELIKEDPKSAELIKPVLRGKYIQKYQTNWEKTKLWLIATFPTLKIDIDRYPAVKKYLFSFGKRRLEQTGARFPDGTKSRKKTIHAWYELQDTCAYYEEFNENKIIWKRIGSDLRFAYCSESVLGLDSVCIATGKRLQVLTAILNSRIARYQLFSYAPKTGTGDLLISVQTLESFLAPLPTENQEEKIEEIFQAIMRTKSSNQYTDISDKESQIDQLAYELYGLTQEEINFIEKIEFH